MIFQSVGHLPGRSPRIKEVNKNVYKLHPSLYLFYIFEMSGEILRLDSVGRNIWSDMTCVRNTFHL